MKKIKITAVCGNGLGSSLLIAMNIKSIVKDLTSKDIDFEVNNIDLASISSSNSNLYVMGADIANSCTVDNKLILNNLINKNELKDKLTQWIEQNVI